MAAYNCRNCKSPPCSTLPVGLFSHNLMEKPPHTQRIQWQQRRGNDLLPGDTSGSWELLDGAVRLFSRQRSGAQIMEDSNIQIQRARKLALKLAVKLGLLGIPYFGNPTTRSVSVSTQNFNRKPLKEQVRLRQRLELVSIRPWLQSAHLPFPRSFCEVATAMILH